MFDLLLLLYDLCDARLDLVERQVDLLLLLAHVLRDVLDLDVKLIFVEGVKGYLIKVGVPEFEDQDSLLSIYFRNLSSCLEEAPATVKHGFILTCISEFSWSQGPLPPVKKFCLALPFITFFDALGRAEGLHR